MLSYIKGLYEHENKKVTLKGWVANKRMSKGLAFIILRDGTGFAQCIIDATNVTDKIFDIAGQLTLESSIEVTGKVIKDEKQIGGYELHVEDLNIFQIAEEYPITKKEHGVDFLMDKRHLWLRSTRQWAIMRIRNQIIYSIHNFYQKEGFVQMDAPIFTGNAVEGTSTLFETDFYGESAYLSQSGQLYGEAMAMAHSKIYTFGPTFRAEKSKTRRHVSEFWMIEPEMAFYDLEMNMALLEKFIRVVVKDVLENCDNELKLLERNIDSLKKVDQTFPRLTYDEAVEILKGKKEVNGKSSLKTLENDLKKLQEEIETFQKEITEREENIQTGNLKKGEINFNRNKIDNLKSTVKELEVKAKNIPQWLKSAKEFKHGNDFGGSDETVLTRLFEAPLMVYKWPKQTKAFYMKQDEQDAGYVKGVDVLAPEGFGEIVGGAERETDKELLIQRIKEHKLPMKAFEWYLDLRRYGSVPHAGFGLGLERLVCWICGVYHIRETIPFPRMYGRLFP